MDRYLTKSSFQNFNPRSHEGSDRDCPVDQADPVADFNPRSHEGSDRLHTSDSGTESNFNPRSHEGSDAVTLGIYTRGINISIHAPTRGATQKRQIQSAQR